MNHAHPRLARGLSLSALGIALLHGAAVGARAEAAEAVLLVPDTIEVLKVDGKKLGLGENLSLSRKRTMTFAPGTHTLVVRYSTIYDVGHDFEVTVCRANTRSPRTCRRRSPCSSTASTPTGRMSTTSVVSSI